MLNFVLLHNYFTYPFNEVQIRYRKDFKFGPGRIFRKIKKIPAKAWLVLANGAVNKNIKSKRKFLKTVSGNSFLLLTCLEPLQTYFYWTTLVTMRLFTQFQFKTRALSSEKMLNFVLLHNYFTYLFTEVQIRYRKAFKFGPGRFFRKIK